jgi:hypothetical protein
LNWTRKVNDILKKHFVWRWMRRMIRLMHSEHR